MAHSKGPEKSMLFQANLAADIGKGVALGLKALGGQLKGGQLQGPTQEVDKKTCYTDDDIAAVMGFSHVLRGDQVQPIWITLNNAKQKNIDVFRCQIFARMMEWSYDRRIPIDTSIFLDADVVKAIVELKFNPGKGVAHLSSALKGLSIMSCRGRTTREIERIREREEALPATEKNSPAQQASLPSKGDDASPCRKLLGVQEQHRHVHVSCVGALWVRM